MLGNAASILNFKDFDMVPGQPAKKMLGPGGTYQNAPVLENLGAEARQIQMDETDMASEYYRSLNALRTFAADQLKRGIDVTSAPDPRVPGSMEAFAAWDRAMQAHHEVATQLVQGRENMIALRDAALQGKITMGQRFFEEPLEVMDQRRMQETIFQNKPAFLDNYNKALSRKPNSKQDAEAMAQFRNQALGEIDDYVQTAGLPAEAAEFYKSQVAPSPEYNDLQDSLSIDESAAKIRASDAMARQRDASAALSRAKIKALKDKAAGKDSPVDVPDLEGLAFVSQFVTDTKNLMAQSMAENGQAPEAIENDTPIFQKNFLGGKVDGGYQFKRMEGGQQGDYKMMFERRNAKGEIDTKEVSFGQDNIWPAYSALLSTKRKNALQKKLEAAGLMQDGKLRPGRVLNYLDGGEANDGDTNDDFLGILGEEEKGGGGDFDDFLGIMQ